MKTQSIFVPARLDFETTFQEHWPRIVAVLFNLTGDRDEAQDLALEVFLRLHRETSQGKDMHNPGGWLYRVATRLGYNALRSRQRRSVYEQAADSPSPAEMTPEALVETRQERERVRQVLRRMKPRSAQLLILRHSGLSYAQVAEALDIPSSSVGTLLARAEKEFTKFYQGS